MQITHQEFLEWKQEEVTKAFFKALHNNREELKEGLVTGLHDDSIMNVQGRCAAVQRILEVEYEDVMESLNV
jgi:hypothetical protein